MAEEAAVERLERLEFRRTVRREFLPLIHRSDDSRRKSDQTNIADD